MSTEERLASLERQLRWLKRLGALAIAVGAVVVLGGQGREVALPNIECGSLVLKDSEGRARLSVGLLGKLEAPLVRFIDSNGRDRIHLRGGDGGQSIEFFDKDGHIRLSIGGSLPSGAFSMACRDADGYPRIAIG